MSENHTHLQQNPEFVLYHLGPAVGKPLHTVAALVLPVLGALAIGPAAVVAFRVMEDPCPNTAKI